VNPGRAGAPGSRLGNLATIGSQLLNVLAFGGSPNETVSGRAYRQRSNPAWARREAWINWLFRDPDHCRTSHLEDVAFARVILAAG
jgi:hypothetical protein